MDSAIFLSQLRDIGLWPADPVVQQAMTEWSRQFPEARLLARELIQRDLLTPYQANQLLTGKGRDLVIGPYRLLERLGEGASGQVFKARHSLMHRLVALKLIRPDRVTNPVLLQRFHREVQAAAKLTHPNVVRAFDADQAANTCYFTMQYVPGTNLSRRVKLTGPLLIIQACDFMRQAALGLEHIHEHGLVHRDIKPSNLAITELPEGKDAGDTGPFSQTFVPGQVKILDLGLARLYEVPTEGQSPQQTLTQLGMVMGTTDYMSPEQGRDSRAVDPRSDLYSLGCTLYYALTGQPPFPGGTALEKLMHHQLDEPERVEMLRPEVPPALAGIVRKLMAKDPAKRYQAAAEVAAALAPFTEAIPPQAIPVAIEPALAKPEVRYTGINALQAIPAAVERAPPQAVSVAILPITGPAPMALPAAEFTLEDAAPGPVVLLTPQTHSQRSRRALGEWAWVGIAGGVALALLLVLAVLRLIR